MLFLLAMANLLFPRTGAVVYGSILLVLAAILYGLGQTGIIPEPTFAETPRSVFLIFLFTLISIAIVMAIASTNFQRNLYEIRRNELELRERNIELDRL